MAIPVAVGRAVGSAVGQVGIQLALEKAFFNKDVKDTVKNTESAFAKGFGNVEKNSGKSFSAIGGIIKSAFAIVGVGAVTQFAKSAVNAASETQAAWTGLNSILSGTGKSFTEGKQFIDEYISDGLIPLQNAVTSYKNLASRGYSTEQIEKTMLALKDAAAFGRQASYSYGDAIQSATEGLKNENSILVDNAGVTKNVAKMWDEYAASIGTTANNLTQQQKIQAEVNGILEETKFQTGDAAAYANTFAGKLARVNTAFYNFKVAVGKFVAPIAELFLPYIEMALNALTRFFNKLGQVLKVFGLELPDVVSKASTSINNVGSSANKTADNITGTGDAAEKAAKKINKAFSNVDEINVLNTNKNASSGSNGGSSGGGGLLDDLGSGFSDDTVIGEVTESLDSGAVKIANKIKELFEPLTKIDLTNLTNAFDRLKESAAPLTEKLFSGLEWLWHNVLVPFAAWTIEDFIPSFFNALAGALDFLNGVLDVAKPYLQYLWEEFLQPIAKWTGGVIVRVFNDIGDVLSKIGKWLSEHAPDIEEVRKQLDPFTDLLKKIGDFLVAIYKVMEPTIELIAKELKNVWDNVLKPILDFISKQSWNGLQTMAKILGGVFDILTGLVTLDFEKIKQGFSDIGTSIKEGLEKSFSNWTELGKDLVKGMAKGIATQVGNWKTWVNDKIWVPLKKGWDSLKAVLGVKTENKTTSKTVSGWWSSIKKWWGSKKLSVSSSISTTKSTVSNWWSNIKKWWGSKKLSISSSISTTRSTLSNWWSNIKSWWGNRTLTISAKLSDVTGNLKKWINTNFIDKVNSKLPGWMGKIPRLAQGGWVRANNPQLALIGDNRHEPEIVSPESKIKEQVVKGIQEAGGTNSQQIEFTINVKYEDGRSIIKKINTTQIKDGKISLLV